MAASDLMPSARYTPSELVTIWVIHAKGRTKGVPLSRPESYPTEGLSLEASFAATGQELREFGSRT